MSGPVIVVVEDDVDIAEVITAQLAGRGYVVHVASNGRDALPLIREVAPHAVVMDRMMPIMDGDSLLTALREDPRFDHLPVIMLTSRSSGSDIQHSFDLGADDYITKPFHGDELDRALRAVLEP